jgi:hypothetical protein
MILMDRVNLMAPRWSHVHSDAQSLEGQERELRKFAWSVGAPVSSFQRGSWLHLDVCGKPRQRALTMPGVRVFESTRELVLHLQACVPRNV